MAEAVETKDRKPVIWELDLIQPNGEIIQVKETFLNEWGALPMEYKRKVMLEINGVQFEGDRTYDLITVFWVNPDLPHPDGDKKPSALYRYNATVVNTTFFEKG